VDIDATPDLLLVIQQKLCIMQYRHGSLSVAEFRDSKRVFICVSLSMHNFLLAKLFYVISRIRIAGGLVTVVTVVPVVRDPACNT